MVLVGRKGKLRIKEGLTDIREVGWHNSEDVLTADVFGAYRYLPPSLGLLPVLYRAADERGQSLGGYLAQFGVTLSNLDIARIRFWPTFRDGSEPDVFVLLESSKNRQSVALLVEAKYHAPQHEIGRHSQLGHYLIQHLADAYADSAIAWELPPGPRPLLFITKHDEIPSSQLRQARKEAWGKFSSVPQDHIGVFWVNWAVVGEEARRLWREHRTEVELTPWLRHLLDLYEEIRDRDLLPRPPFVGIPRPHFSDLRLPYIRTYAKLPLESEELPSIARQHDDNSSLGSVPAGVWRYCRSYQPGWEGWDHIPATYPYVEGRRT